MLAPTTSRPSADAGTTSEGTDISPSIAVSSCLFIDNCFLGVNDISFTWEFLTLLHLLRPAGLGRLWDMTGRLRHAPLCSLTRERFPLMSLFLCYNHCKFINILQQFQPYSPLFCPKNRFWRCFPCNCRKRFPPSHAPSKPGAQFITMHTQE